MTHLPFQKAGEYTAAQSILEPQLFGSKGHKTPFGTYTNDAEAELHDPAAKSKNLRHFVL